MYHGILIDTDKKMSLFTFFILWVVDFNDLYDKRYKDNKIGAKSFRIQMYIVNIYEYLTPYLRDSHGRFLTVAEEHNKREALINIWSRSL